VNPRDVDGPSCLLPGHRKARTVAQDLFDGAAFEAVGIATKQFRLIRVTGKLEHGARHQARRRPEGAGVDVGEQHDELVVAQSITVLLGSLIAMKGMERTAALTSIVPASACFRGAHA
jgi:hypothetical protein